MAYQPLDKKEIARRVGERLDTAEDNRSIYRQRAEKILERVPLEELLVLGIIEYMREGKV